MKKLISVISLCSIILLISSECDNDDDQLGCGGSNNGKTKITQYLKDWFPYDSLYTDSLVSLNRETVTYYINEIVMKDSIRPPFLECPGGLTEFHSGSVVINGDTLSFYTEQYNTYIVELDDMEFSIGDYPIGRRVTPYNPYTEVELVPSQKIINKTYDDLIIATSDTGSIQKLYLSHKMGLVGIEVNDTIYELQ